ncbi:MAG: glycosyltransferase family 2 protein [Fibromonadaceae bacterium]|jgi:cellulose synthase/poly-beta-1,6-N-acetylglucosamine synthase-like glycosyltransferase|nr:glycosyltransferase family 2 protein [Fibromonadaceae bacterium]
MLKIAIFWLCLILLTQVYILYPLSMRFFSLFKKKASSPQKSNKFVSIIISAYNEADSIEEKILNTLALDWPKEKMEILIGDDGSSDGTSEIAERYSSQIHFLKNEKNEGKAAMLNKLCKLAKGEVFLLSDANAMLESDALMHLVPELENEDVGCVCGLLSLKSENEDDSSLSETEILYWKKESRLKELEGRFGAVMGSNGALYAIRSELYPELPTHKTVMDDFYITAKILMKGYSGVFCENARAYENVSAEKYGEFSRKVRIGRANFNFLSSYLPLLSPLRPMRAYIFLSHKLLRWFSPFMLLAVALCSVFLIQKNLFYKAFFTLELMFVVAAFMRLRTYNYFLSMNAALFIGFFKSFFKEKNGAWKRVKRG